MSTQQTIARPSAQTFRLRTALLSKGRTTDFLASTGGDGHAMSIAIKCYAEGGENEFHAHMQEDHTFIVLQGRAIFHQPDLPDKELGRNEGILLPVGAYYKFEAVPGEPLVLLRVGNTHHARLGLTDGRPESDSDTDGRRGTDGNALPSHSAANKHIDGVAIPGAFYE
jgi:mannose-6-phosphate isomerase-like protein (cupin superfamily)